MTPTRPARRMAIVSAQLIDGSRAAPLPDATVMMQGGHIVAVGPAEEISLAGDEEVTIIRGKGMTLLPGIIDSHVHLTFRAAGDHATTLATVMGEDDQTLLARALGNGMRALCAGVTTVRDLGGPGSIVQAARQAVRAGLCPGPRILAAGRPITTTGGHLYFCGLEADSDEELLKAVRGEAKAGADWIKICATGGNMTPGTNPFAPQYRGEQLRLVVAEAHRLGRRVAAHAIGSAGIREAIDGGVDTIEHCQWYGETIGQIDLDEASLEAMGAKGLWAGLPLPGGYRSLLPSADAPGERRRGDMERLRAELAGMRTMIEYGVPYVLSSDAGVRGTRFDAPAESLKVAVVALGLSPLQALRAVTGEAARALGLEGEIGTVRPGKRADLLLVEGDPLTDLGALGRVRRVYRDGLLVCQDGMAVV